MLLVKFLELFSSDDVYAASLQLFSKLGIEFHETSQEIVADYLDCLLRKPHNERDDLGLWSTRRFEEPVFLLHRERTRHEDELRMVVNYSTEPLTMQLSEKSMGEFEHGFRRFHADALSNDSSAVAC